MRLAAVLLGVLASGCERPQPRTPEAGYTIFLEALRKGDARGAWSQLSRSSQLVVEARAKLVSDASRQADGGVLIKNDPAAMLFQSGMRVTPPASVTVTANDGGAAMLEVGSGQQIAMVREGERWLVDLSATLGDTPP
jgi:hypothetical protein